MIRETRVREHNGGRAKQGWDREGVREVAREVAKEGSGGGKGGEEKEGKRERNWSKQRREKEGSKGW